MLIFSITSMPIGHVPCRRRSKFRGTSTIDALRCAVFEGYVKTHETKEGENSKKLKVKNKKER